MSPNLIIFISIAVDDVLAGCGSTFVVDADDSSAAAAAAATLVPAADAAAAVVRVATLHSYL